MTLEGGFIEFLPPEWKVEYCAAQAGSWESDWFSKVAWELITPGSTAVFLALTGLWYAWKTKKETDAAVKAVYKQIAIAFLLWGLFNGVVYMLLVWHQGQAKLPGTPTQIQKPKLLEQLGAPPPALRSRR